MTSNIILDVIIGLIFVYLLLSLICSAIQETIASAAGLRAETLQDGIKNLLDDPNILDAQEKVRDLKTEVYQHPLVKNLAKEGNKPSYIPARNFTIALLDVLKDPNSSNGPLTEARNTISKLPAGQLKNALAGIVDGAGNSVESMTGNIETWFDNSMGRVSGWYKRSAQKLMLLIAFTLAVSFNVDSIELAKTLWKDPALRAQVVTAAQQQVDAGKSTEEPQTIKDLRSELNKVPVGWDKENWGSLFSGNSNFILKLLGWILTAIAVSLGAPFWFDGLGKVLNIRRAGARPASGGTTTT